MAKFEFGLNEFMYSLIGIDSKEEREAIINAYIRPRKTTVKELLEKDLKYTKKALV